MSNVDVAWQLILTEPNGFNRFVGIVFASTHLVPGTLFFGHWSSDNVFREDKRGEQAVCVLTVDKASKQLVVERVVDGEAELAAAVEPTWRDVKRLAKLVLALSSLIISQCVFTAYFCWLVFQAAAAVDVGFWPATWLVRTLALLLPIGHFVWLTTWMFRYFPTWFTARLDNGQ